MSLIFKCIKSGWSLMTRVGGRIRLSVSSALLTFAAMLPLTVSVYLNTVIFGNTVETRPEEYLLVYSLVILFNVFIVAPVTAVFFSYAYEVYSAARYGAPYRKKRAGGYFRNLFGGMLLTVRFAVCAVVLQVAYALTPMLEKLLGLEEYGLPMLILAAPLMTLALGFCLLFCWITSGAFLMPYYFARGEGIFSSLGKSYKALVKHPFLKDGYALVFLPLMALSVFTFGVLLILFVMPLMMFTYFTLAEYIDGGELLEDR